MSSGQAVAIFVALMLIALLMIMLTAAVLFRGESNRARDLRRSAITAQPAAPRQPVSSAACAHWECQLISDQCSWS